MNEAALIRPVPAETGAAEKKWKVVYTIVERPERAGEPPRKFWVRIGSAFINRDQSMNVRLDALPTNSMLHIRDYEPPENRRREDHGNYRNAEGGY